MVRLIHDDCFKILPKIPDNCIDLILTDPPYNISQHSTGNIHLPNRKPLNNDIAAWDKNPLDIQTLSYHFKRIVKPNGNIFIFTSYNLLGQWHSFLDKEFDTFQIFIWHKTNPPPKIYKNGFLNSCECIICLWNKGHTWNFLKQKDMHNFFECSICMSPERLKNPHHPTQKPLKLLKHLITVASNSGDLVFDPFMGVGSTGIAALNLNRRFAGCEINLDYFLAAKQRIISFNI